MKLNYEMILWYWCAGLNVITVSCFLCRECSLFGRSMLPVAERGPPPAATEEVNLRS